MLALATVVLATLVPLTGNAGAVTSTLVFGPPTSSEIFYGVAISCTDRVDCTIVGGDTTPQVQTETNGVWNTPVTLAVPPSTSSVTFGGYLGQTVSCPTANNCTAVGDIIPNVGPEQAMFATETNGTWGAVTEIPGSPTGQGALTAVSCFDATDCTAVGYDGDNDPIVVSETGGAWSTPSELFGLPAGGWLFGVSCTGIGDCTAAGEIQSESYSGPMVVTESGGNWGAPLGIPNASSTNAAAFYGISCIDATDCTAVGNGGPFLGNPSYAVEKGGTWGGLVTLPVLGHFQGVDCTGMEVASVSAWWPPPVRATSWSMAECGVLQLEYLNKTQAAD